VQVNDSRAKQVLTGFDQLQRDYDLKSAKLCSALEEDRITPEEYSRRSQCQMEVLDAFRTMNASVELLRSSQAETDPAWLIESHMSWIREAARCERPPSVADVVPESEIPASDPPRQKGLLHLAASAASQPEPISLDAMLICERRQPDGSFVEVERCNHATLTENDRFKVAFATDRDAYAYVFLYNEKGQFQMLFPAPGIPNKTTAATNYILPPGDDWFVLDAVGGVTEYVHVVAAPSKILELEKVRGADVPPDQQRDTQLAIRGAIESTKLQRRGFDMSGFEDKPITLSGGRTPSAPPVSVEGEDVVGVEFEIVHE